MRLTLTGDPLRLVKWPDERLRWILLRVISGNIRVGLTDEQLRTGGGLPVASADGLLSLPWETAEVWVAGVGELVIVLP